jgi:hypothetical protein
MAIGLFTAGVVMAFEAMRLLYCKNGVRGGRNAGVELAGSEVRLF